jgi:hypothetical protein
MPACRRRRDWVPLDYPQGRRDDKGPNPRRKRARFKIGRYEMRCEMGRVEERPVAPGGAGDEGFCWLLNVGAEAPTP